jgi:DNA invertase Pin-like site-specific DNA recombinase
MIEVSTTEDTMSKGKRAAMYARVSTDQQTTDNQLMELRHVAERSGWTVVAEYVDHGVSGAKGRKDRPQFDALLKGVARREFDLVAAWSVDRLGRSLSDLLDCLSELQAKGVDVYLHQQAVDTSTPGGKTLFQMMGVFAEFERAMIRERVNVGLARARAKGKVLGRPKARPEVEARIRELAAQGIGKGKTARMLGIGVSVVQRVLA